MGRVHQIRGAERILVRVLSRAINLQASSGPKDAVRLAFEGAAAEAKEVVKTR